MEREYENFMTKNPEIHPSVFIAKGAQITGDVRIEEDASIWYNSVLRGDVEYISIGKRTNVQDGSIIHVDYDKPCIIGNDVVIGHHVNLHGCIIEEGCLIGIGAIVLSGAIIKKGSIIAAGAVVKEGEEVPEYSLMAGVPARKIRTDTNILEKNILHAKEYVKLAKLHMKKYK